MHAARMPDSVQIIKSQIHNGIADIGDRIEFLKRLYHSITDHATRHLRLSNLPLFSQLDIQMNKGAELASGSILLFLHADTLLPGGGIDAVFSVLQNPHRVGGAFDLGIRSSRWGYRIIETVATTRSRITRLPYGDQAIFLRKDFFHMIGGYSPIPIMEDVDIMQRIKKRGDAIEIINKRVQTNPRRWEKDGLVFGTLRNWILMILYLMGVSPHKLGRWYK